MLVIAPAACGTQVELALAAGPGPAFHSFHIPCTAGGEEDSIAEWKSRRQAHVYPPNCSVNLLMSLFKSLSFLRTSSIFSTECSTVV